MFTLMGISNELVESKYFPTYPYLHCSPHFAICTFNHSKQVLSIDLYPRNFLILKSSESNSRLLAIFNFGQNPLLVVFYHHFLLLNKAIFFPLGKLYFSSTLLLLSFPLNFTIACFCFYFTQQSTTLPII